MDQFEGPTERPHIPNAALHDVRSLVIDEQVSPLIQPFVEPPGGLAWRPLYVSRPRRAVLVQRRPRCRNGSLQ